MVQYQRITGLFSVFRHLKLPILPRPIQSRTRRVERRTIQAEENSGFRSSRRIEYLM